MSLTPDEQLIFDKEWARYINAMHAVQTGVATMMQIDTSATEPKHLRVGVNSAMIETATLTRLLIKKGIITELEHVSALADAAEEEVKRYEDKVRGAYGRDVKIRLV